jgi:hypothetical protein
MSCCPTASPSNQIGVQVHPQPLRRLTPTQGLHRRLGQGRTLPRPHSPGADRNDRAPHRSPPRHRNRNVGGATATPSPRLFWCPQAAPRRHPRPHRVRGLRGDRPCWRVRRAQRVPQHLTRRHRHLDPLGPAPKGRSACYLPAPHNKGSSGLSTPTVWRCTAGRRLT